MFPTHFLEQGTFVSYWIFQQTSDCSVLKTLKWNLIQLLRPESALVSQHTVVNSATSVNMKSLDCGVEVVSCVHNEAELVQCVEVLPYLTLIQAKMKRLVLQQLLLNLNMRKDSD